MACGPANGIVAAMDRSLTADDFRILDRLNRTPSRQAAPPPALAELPGWFRVLVTEQCAWLGIPVPGIPAGETHLPEAA
jgi:hypothetical protein